MENERETGSRFHTFYSNSFEVLEKIFFQMAERDRKRLAKGQSGSAFPGLFTPITVIVPSRAVGNRLSRGYASGSGEGISAGFNFVLPGEWLTPFLGAQVGSLAQTPELEWLIWNRLLEDDFLKDPRSENVRHYLTDPITGNARGEDDTARMELAVRVSAAFAKYATYRFDWVYRWMTGEGIEHHRVPNLREERERVVFQEHPENAGWEEGIWRWLAEDAGADRRRWHGAGQLLSLADRLARPPLVSDDTAPLHIFGLSALPPLMLPFLYQQSFHRSVSLYLINPSPEYWFDASGAEESGCPWLRRNAGQSRAIVDRLWKFTQAASAPVVEDDVGSPKETEPETRAMPFNPATPIQDAELLSSPEPPFIKANLARISGRPIDQRGTMLDRVHEAVLRNNTAFLEDLDPEELEAWTRPEIGMPSVRIAAAPTLAREAEAAADWIYALKAEHPELTASDFLIVTPDLQAAAPVFDAVFSSLPKPIAYGIVGRSLFDSSGAAQAYIALGNFLCGTADINAFSSLISLPAIAENWGFGVEDLGTIRSWLDDAGFRLGISETHIANLSAMPGNRYIDDGTGCEGTLMRALERLTLAAMAGDEESEQDAWLDVRPKSGGGFSTRVTSRTELFQALVRFTDGLDAAERLIFELEDQGTDDWKPVLQMLLDQFFPKGKSWWAAPDLENLRAIVTREAETARDAAVRSGRAQPIRIPFPVMWSAVTRRFKSGSVPARPTGAIAISSMDALRGIPFKAICVVGLDAASGFPGTVQLDEFDLMGLPGLKRRGDRDSRRDNRNIFFDLIMSARSWFSVFYAEGPEKERPLPPSEVVTDFRGFLTDLEASRALATGTAARNTWDTEVPLARYSCRNFTAEAAANHLLGSSVDAFEAIREGGGNGEEKTFLGAGAALPGYSDFRLPAADLAAFLTDPEKFATKLVGLTRDESGEVSSAALGFPDDTLSQWQMRHDVIDAAARGETLENFVSVRMLDPAYGTKAVRKAALPLVSERHFRAARLVSDLTAGEAMTLGSYEMLIDGPSAPTPHWTVEFPSETLYRTPGGRFASIESFISNGEKAGALLRAAARGVRHPDTVTVLLDIKTLSGLDDTEFPSSASVLKAAGLLEKDAEPGGMPKGVTLLYPGTEDQAELILRTGVMFFSIMKLTAMIPGSARGTSPFFRGEEGAREKKTSSGLREKLLVEMESYLRTRSESRGDGAAFTAAGKALELELQARAARLKGNPDTDLIEDRPDAPLATDILL